MISKRQNLTAKEVEDKSTAITLRIIDSDLFADVKKVAGYLPTKNEVDTKSVINFLVEVGASTYLPKFFGKEYKLVRFDSWTDLAEGPYEILEPVGDETISVDEIDLAFIPGVAFDKKGVRLGYGKGVYDKLLSKSKAMLVGLAYEFQVVDALPREDHDLTMNLVITDEKVYQFSQPK